MLVKQGAILILMNALLQICTCVLLGPEDALRICPVNISGTGAANVHDCLLPSLHEKFRQASKCSEDLPGEH